jgi:hypothetical protein
MVKPLEIAQINKIDFRSIKIKGDGVIPIKKDGKTGIWEVQMPGGLSSVVTNSKVDCSNVFPRTNLLGTKLTGQDQTERIFSFSDLSENFYLTVFHGATNEKILRMSQLANSNSDLSEPERAEYQTLVADLITPVIRKKSKDAPDLWIIEDCVATGDTISGVLALLKEKSLIRNEAVKPIKKVRIDVVVATAQGIFVLREFARQKGIALEINVGSLAFGLNEDGYLVYTPEVAEKEEFVKRGLLNGSKKPEDIYVVGDMGDASKKLSDSSNQLCPWNKLRDDSWGDSGNTRSEVGKLIQTDSSVALFFANGGWLMKALAEHLRVLDDFKQCVISAKRVDQAAAVLVNYISK